MQLNVLVLPALLPLPLDSLVMIVDCHRQAAFGPLLTDHVVIKQGLDLGGLKRWASGKSRRLVLTQIFIDNFVTEINAFIADKNTRAGDQFLDIALRLAAK